MLDKLVAPVKALFSATRDMSAQEAREYINSHRADQFTLLDVRQPAEYERGHLPGAQFIPLPELSERLGEVDKNKPAIVYCASGVRSRAGAEMLAQAGVAQASSMAGGIKAWQGEVAQGPYELGLGLLKGDEDAGRLLQVAQGLEEGLRQFYEAAAQAAGDQRARQVWEQLASMEKGHQDRVWALYLAGPPPHAERQAWSAAASAQVMEGGWSLEEAQASFHTARLDAMMAVEVAMYIEAQALDLYLRLARKVSGEDARQTLLALSQEERDHLRTLGRLVQQISQQS